MKASYFLPPITFLFAAVLAHADTNATASASNTQSVSVAKVQNASGTQSTTSTAAKAQNAPGTQSANSTVKPQATHTNITQKASPSSTATASTLQSTSSSPKSKTLTQPIDTVASATRTQAGSGSSAAATAAVSSAEKKTAQPKKQQPQLVAVKQIRYQNDHTFQSTIRPVVKSTITSPTKGKITQVGKVYGDRVKSGDLILNMNSNEAKKQLMSSVVDYIQSKSSYHDALATLRKNIELQKKGVISKQELSNSESSYISALINLVSTRIEFKKTATSLNFDWKRIDKLDLSNNPLFEQKGGAEEAVEFLLNKEYIVPLKSHTNGIFLPKISEDSNNEHIDFMVGATIKEDQVVGMIASPDKLRLKIEVPEFDIVNVYKGQPVVMKIPALDHKTMQGKVVDVRRFQYKDRSGDVPTIPVHIEISCAEDHCERYYSISAEASLVNDAKMTLQLPITAVGTDSGTGKKQHFVKLYSKGKIIKQKVSVGATTADMIIIRSGLKKGDEVVKNYKDTES